MSLEDWLENHWLEKRPTSQKEIRGLIQMIERDLAKSKEDENIDYRLMAVHLAVYNCATLALRCRGLRLKKNLPGHHEKAINSLRFTLGLESGDIEFLNNIRKLRTTAEYEFTDVASEDEVEEARLFMVKLFQELIEWLKTNHPEFW